MSRSTNRTPPHGTGPPNEERLRWIVASSPSVLYVLHLREDGSQSPVWVSPNIADLTGYSAEETFAPGWWNDHIHPADRERAAAEAATIGSTGFVAREYRIRHRAGRYLCIRDETRLFADPDGTRRELVGSWSDVTEHRRAEEALQESEERYRSLFETSPLPMWVYDPDPASLRIVAVNDAALEQYGYSREELLSMSIRDVWPPEDAERLGTALASRPAGDAYTGTFRHRRRNGTLLDVDVRSDVVVLGGRTLRLALLQDVTEHKRLEEQFRQSQKMEAVGRLAGGVAHDFNNLLTVINGYAEILLADLPADLSEDDATRQGLVEITRAGERAAALTRQLLAFSRKQVLNPEILSLNDVVAGIESMLRRLMGEDVALVISLGTSLGNVRADRGQMEQVIVNLAVNARDAMPEGGTLTLETCNVELEETLEPAAPGSYVRLDVRDTGTGMDAATLSHIFEPFFTTKGQGKGTGLGLATVYGIVRQSGGQLRVSSEPGRGTAFEIFLPHLESSGDPAPRTRTKTLVTPGLETILLVEDEEALRRLAREILKRNGYTVLEAFDPAMALALLETHAGPIHALLTDVVMPGMNGPQLARQVAARRPGIRVIYMSGYSDRSVLKPEDLASGSGFLAKPFHPDELAAKVREVLLK